MHVLVTGASKGIGLPGGEEVCSRRRVAFDLFKEWNRNSGDET